MKAGVMDNQPPEIVYTGRELKQTRVEETNQHSKNINCVDLLNIHS